ncbi:MAG: DNA methyltransferase, partial [Alistipes sp.]|nr:DNA methyltransferase [Alistipes sp.]
RPFDTKYIYFDDRIIWRPRSKVMQHLLYSNNIGLVFSRQAITNNWSHIQIVNTIIDNRLHYSSKGTSLCSPLYLYDNMLTDGIRHPNLKPEIIDKIANNIGLAFESEKSGDADKFAPIDLLDYIYAVLHSPAYREKYKEFLKTDFPRVPYPTSAGEFRRLAGIGSELRSIHLMEHPELDNFITQYPVAGNNVVEKVRWEVLTENIGRVWINSEQYFDNVPLMAWEFYIGGYQPAQKWLKDRSGQVLGFDDIRHYQRIIKALMMTEEKIKEIVNYPGNNAL